MGKQHFLSGGAAWLAGCALLTYAGHPPDPIAVVVGTPLCAASALVPDLDHPKSIAARSLGPLTRVLAWGVSKACGHRGLTHTGAACLAVGGVATLGAGFGLGWSWWWLGFAVGAGMLIHVLGDSATLSGTPLLWPLPIGRLPRDRDGWRTVGLWRPLRFRTGKGVELWLVRPLLWAVLLGSVAWLARLHSHDAAEWVSSVRPEFGR